MHCHEEEDVYFSLASKMMNEAVKCDNAKFTDSNRGYDRA